MSKLHADNSILGVVGSAIGIGLLAGLAGTAAITLSQAIEMKADGRKPSTAPVDAVSKVLNVKETAGAKKQKVSQEVHWVYGTSLGMLRGAFGALGLKGWKATLAHFATVWGGSMIMLPSLKVAPPPNKEDGKTLAIDGLHHAVYATAAGLVFDAITKKRKQTLAGA